MDKELIIKKIEEVAKDNAFIEKVADVKSADELKAVLASYSIEIPDDEKEEIFKNMTNTINGELAEDDLENVSGGLTFVTAALAFAVGCYIGDKINKARGKK